MKAEKNLDLIIQDSNLSAVLKNIAEKVRSNQRISIDEGIIFTLSLPIYVSMIVNSALIQS